MKTKKKTIFGVEIEKVEASTIKVGDEIRADGRWYKISKIEDSKFKSGGNGLKISFTRGGSLKFRLDRILQKAK